ncbi:ABC transporter ATP-binding protein [Stetteria hydrogenophila]
MPGEALIHARGLRKTYPGGVEALRGVSLDARGGEVVALVGPNGAGKTTTLRIIVGLLRPDEGEVRVAGFDPFREPVEARRRLGYLPEDAGVYRRMTGWDFLLFTARLYAGSEAEALEMARRGAEISGLGDALRRPMGGYSKGMKRRILLARTLMTEPEAVVLDEPTSGLDVEHAVEVRRVVREYARSRGAAVLVSSHNMFEVEYVADRVYLISSGAVVEEGSPGELLERHGARNLEEVYMKVVGRRGEA